MAVVKDASQNEPKAQEKSRVLLNHKVNETIQPKAFSAVSCLWSFAALPPSPPLLAATLPSQYACRRCVEVISRQSCFS